MAVMNTRPEQPVASAAAKAGGMIATPGCVSMRNVSHFPPANIISAFTKAAPALVKRSPEHKAVAAVPGSSSRASVKASFVAGMFQASKAEDSACRITPLARSTTAGGRSSYFKSATKEANWRDRDMVGFLFRSKPPAPLEGRQRDPEGNPVFQGHASDFLDDFHLRPIRALHERDLATRSG